MSKKRITDVGYSELLTDNDSLFINQGNAIKQISKKNVFDSIQVKIDEMQSKIDEANSNLNNNIQAQIDEINASFSTAANNIGNALVALGVDVPEGTSLLDMAFLISENLHKTVDSGFYQVYTSNSYDIGKNAASAKLEFSDVVTDNDAFSLNADGSIAVKKNITGLSLNIDHEYTAEYGNVTYQWEYLVYVNDVLKATVMNSVSNSHDISGSTVIGEIDSLSSGDTFYIMVQGTSDSYGGGSPVLKNLCLNCNIVDAGIKEILADIVLTLDSSNYGGNGSGQYCKAEGNTVTFGFSDGAYGSYSFTAHTQAFDVTEYDTATVYFGGTAGSNTGTTNYVDGTFKIGSGEEVEWESALQVPSRSTVIDISELTGEQSLIINGKWHCNYSYSASFGGSFKIVKIVLNRSN